jgi:uncharacterized protein (DUF1697 family)
MPSERSDGDVQPSIGLRGVGRIEAPQRGTVTTTYVALLRAVNVGGRNPIAMSALRECAARLGLRAPRTLLQSGNLVFESGTGDPADLERVLERGTAKHLGLRTDFMVRSAADWQAIIDHNPFPRQAKNDPGHLVVMLFKEAAGAADVKALRAAIVGREVVEAVGAHAYLLYPDGIGRSRLTTALIERTLGTRGTGRNWNTVVKLAALAAA